MEINKTNLYKIELIKDFDYSQYRIMIIAADTKKEALKVSYKYISGLVYNEANGDPVKEKVYLEKWRRKFKKFYGYWKKSNLNITLIGSTCLIFTREDKIGFKDICYNYKQILCVSHTGE